MNNNNIVEKINNRFDLILIASRRARQIQNKEKENLIDNQNKNKCTVLALKEVEDNHISGPLLNLE